VTARAPDTPRGTNRKRGDNVMNMTIKVNNKSETPLFAASIERAALRK
jgi:hypothetical protein